MKLEKSVGFVLLTPAQEFILLKHASGNHYDFCKGHPLKNEAPLVTAKREVWEELNLKVDHIFTWRNFSYYYIKKQLKQVEWYLATVADMRPLAIDQQEIIDVILAPYPQAKQQLTYQSSRYILESAYQYLCQQK